LELVKKIPGVLFKKEDRKNMNDLPIMAYALGFPGSLLISLMSPDRGNGLSQRKHIHGFPGS
jgi:hypothetical protein